MDDETHFLICADPVSPRVLCDSDDWTAASANPRNTTCFACAAIYELDEPEPWPIVED